jgi:NAD(P)-dependent dehydrogenase (short-subunit alcohol dehydrogenase family)
MGRVAGKVAIITGGGSGIGAATAVLLAREGAAVAVVDVLPERAERVAHEVEGLGGDALALTVDVSDEAQVKAMVDTVVEAYGRLDVLHNNAALVDPTVFDHDRGLLEMDVEVWDRTMAVNLRGPMLGCKHAVPAMIASGGGSIVNMSSVSSLVGHVERTAYGASKAGVNTLSRYVATQFGRQRVRANTVLPGLVLTPAADVNLADDHRAVLADNVLTPHFGQPDDIAHLVLYLASDEATYVTGQQFVVDGGLSAHNPTYAQFQAARSA